MISERPGIRTSEFQLAIINVAIGVVLIGIGLFEFRSSGWAAITSIIVGGGLLGLTYWSYARARADVKSATIEMNPPSPPTRSL